MNEKAKTFSYPGFTVRLHLLMSETAPLLSDVNSGDENRNVFHIYSNRISYRRSEKDLQRLFHRSFTRQYIESQSLMDSFFNLCILNDYLPLHGVAISWKDQGILLSAPSGTGKTTQFVNWKKIDPDGVEIINGDKPVVSLRKENFLSIYSSPWTGKECFFSNLSAPLGLIVFLKQSKKNRLARMSEKEAALALLPQVLIQPVSEHLVKTSCFQLEQVLRSVPVYLFENDGTLESTRYLKERLAYEMGK